MVDKEYPVGFEISGWSAMFTRPDTGSSPVSYPAPTRGAARAMFESVARIKSAYIQPTHVELCAPVQYEKYVTNYGGPLRLDRRNSFQLIALRLINVCYRVHGVVRPLTTSPGKHNHLHALQAMFTRRLDRGQCYYTPFLGWKEFVPSYFGPLRDGTEIDQSVNLNIPSMLLESFPQPGDSTFNPHYVQDIQIKEGVLEYAE